MSTDAAATGRTYTISEQERQLIVGTIDYALQMDELVKRLFSDHGANIGLKQRERIQTVRNDLGPDIASLGEPQAPQGPRLFEPTIVSMPQPTRAQEHAGDAMAAKYGRSSVRMQADGSAVITGLTDDIDRETVCINPDGTERWRR